MFQRRDLGSKRYCITRVAEDTHLGLQCGSIAQSDNHPLTNSVIDVKRARSASIRLTSPEHFMIGIPLLQEHFEPPARYDN